MLNGVQTENLSKDNQGQASQSVMLACVCLLYLFELLPATCYCVKMAADIGFELYPVEIYPIGSEFKWQRKFYCHNLSVLKSIKKKNANNFNSKVKID